MKRYVLVGTGYRGSWMYAKSLTANYTDCAELVGLFDINGKRADYISSQMPGNIPTYTDFDKMMEELKPDCAIITTIDRFHHEYIVKTLEKGIDVICEKPMTMDAEKAKEILEAERRTGKKITVTFNMRFQPYLAKIKELLRTGVIGDVLHVNLEWMLDTSHGADYFRRWHRYLENCGGLLVHKATHHFDVVNWLIEQDPVSVFANGTLNYYGKDRRPHGERCCKCEYREKCELAFPDAEAPDIKDLYFGCEDVDGYYRDRCLFDGSINIYDTMSLNVKYDKGALMTYSLIAHSPYEGWKLSISGTKGRLEACQIDNGVNASEKCNYVNIYTRDGDLATHAIPRDSSMHGGGDRRMLNMIFRGGIEDTLDQCAGSRDGLMSIMIGICANESIKTGKEIKVKDLVDTDYYFGDEDNAADAVKSK